MKAIHTDNAPKAVGSYSQAIVVDKLIFCSGQIGLYPVTGEMAEGLERQLRQIMENIKAVLTACGSDLRHTVKTTVFLTRSNDFTSVNTIYGEYFTDHKPARSTVVVAGLPKGALIEIEVIASLLEK